MNKTKNFDEYFSSFNNGFELNKDGDTSLSNISLNTTEYMDIYAWMDETLLKIRSIHLTYRLHSKMDIRRKFCPKKLRHCQMLIRIKMMLKIQKKRIIEVGTKLLFVFVSGVGLIDMIKVKVIIINSKYFVK